MDATLLSLVDLLKDVALAFFAISTWYIAREEKRARILFNLCLNTPDKMFHDLSELLIELRDKKGVADKMKNKVSAMDLKRMERKLSKLITLDFVRNLSVALFSLLVLIEITMFVRSVQFISPIHF